MVKKSLAENSALLSSHHRQLIHLMIAEETELGCRLLKDSFKRLRTQLTVASCTVSHEQTIQSLMSQKCDIALINDSLSDGPLTGFRTVRDVRRLFPRTRVIMLLRSNHRELVVDAFRAGAKGIYCRTEPLKSLTKCVLSVHKGQIWANASQLDSVFSAFAEAAPLGPTDTKRRPSLTKRESEVVSFIVDGMSNREAAEQLGVTEHTVSNYLFRIYQKLGISSRVELVLYSLDSNSNGQPAK